MFARFRTCAIRSQIIALAIGPVILVSFLAAVTEPLTLKDFESVSYARMTALNIELVLAQVAAADTPLQRATILEATSKTGLRVEELPASELSVANEASVAVKDQLQLIRSNLPESYQTRFRESMTAGKRTDVLVVSLDSRTVLAFSPAPPPSDSWINDHQVNIVLMVIVVILPVLLLSLYASFVIAAPLTQFSKSAEKLKPDEGPDRPFGEQGAVEIRTLARSLNDMHSRVRSMIDDRTRMLRAISHDLRTPLTRLRLRAERSNQPELRTAILRDVASLSGMIEETLTYLSKDMMTEKPVKADLPSLLETVCSDFSDMGFSVSYEGPNRFAYACKPRSLARALTNLVENSTKFAKDIRVKLATEADGRVIITVIDDGPGLPADLRRRVLEPFFKVDAARASKDRAGFGLGLSIVDDIVRSHGGTIALLDTDPHGLTVQMGFPAREQATQPKSTGLENGPDAISRIDAMLKFHS